MLPLEYHYYIITDTLIYIKLSNLAQFKKKCNFAFRMNAHA